MDQIINDFKLDATIHSNYTVHQVGHHREKWHQERKLGQGGFGTVWLEREEATNRCRAVKIIAGSCGLDFRRELFALEKFSRPKFRQHFVQFYGWYDHISHGRSSIFLAMEYLSHGDLRNFIKTKGALVENDVMAVARDLAGGLRMLHEEGFTHRDLKLENILVVSHSPRLVIKIGDFGLAKRIVDDQSALRSQVGTPEYYAPEQVNDQRSTDEYTNAVDMWCLGHVVFELLSGKKVFQDRNELRKFCEGISDFPRRDLQAIAASRFCTDSIERLMARHPSERPSASECWSSLQRYLPGAASVSASTRLETLEHYLPNAASTPASSQLPRHIGSTSTVTSADEDLDEEEKKLALQLQSVDWVDLNNKAKGIKEKLLLWAASEGAGRVIKLLLREGADIDGGHSWDSDGKTALHYAVLHGHYDIVRFLLEKGANVWIRTRRDKITALHYAVEDDDDAIVELLIQKEGALVNTVDNRKRTALHVAVIRDHERMVRLLLENGADINATDEDRYTPFLRACKWGSDNWAMVRLLLERAADIREFSEMKNRLLTHSVFLDDEALTSLLLEKGADIEAIDEKYREVLHIDTVPERQSLEYMASFMLKNLPKLEAVRKGRSVLYVAVCLGHEGIVKLLLEKGANANVANLDGETALQKAVGPSYHNASQLSQDHGLINEDPFRESYDRSSYIVRLLLQHGADIEAIDWGGRTALHKAVMKSNEHVVKLLLDNRANVEATNNHGETALQNAVTRGNEHMVKLLLESRANIEATDNHGQTALQHAIRNGKREVVKLLLDNAANTEATDSHGETALQYAVRTGKKDMVKLLLDNGANVNVTNYHGETALQLAVREYKDDMVKLLLENGANTEATDSQGETALQYAVREGKKDMVKLLLTNGADKTKLSLSQRFRR